MNHHLPLFAHADALGSHAGHTLSAPYAQFVAREMTSDSTETAASKPALVPPPLAPSCAAPQIAARDSRRNRDESSRETPVPAADARYAKCSNAFNASAPRSSRNSLSRPSRSATISSSRDAVPSAAPSTRTLTVICNLPARTVSSRNFRKASAAASRSNCPFFTISGGTAKSPLSNRRGHIRSLQRQHLRTAIVTPQHLCFATSSFSPMPGQPPSPDAACSTNTAVRCPPSCSSKYTPPTRSKLAR